METLLSNPKEKCNSRRHSQSRNPKQRHYLAAPNASGIRSTVYLYPLIYMQGTPGIFRIRPRNSLSHVATIKHFHCVAIFVKQSSAYPFFLQLHGTRSKRGSFASRNAILYFPPNFSSSAITQSVTQGMHLAKRQSIMARIMSNFFLKHQKFNRFIQLEEIDNVRIENQWIFQVKRNKSTFSPTESIITTK